MRASRSVMASSARANWRRALPPRSSEAFSARPLASTATVSLVDWSLSTVMRLNEPSTARRSTRGSESRATNASGGRKHNNVAKCGALIPSHLAMQAMVTGRPATSTSSAASFGLVSVVMIASAARRPPCGDSPITSLGSPARILSMGSGWPMTPVDAMSTWRGAIRSSSPVIRVISRASLIPCSPVQTLEQPAEARIAWARPSRTCSCETSTGAPLIWLVVNTAAARAGEDE